MLKNSSGIKPNSLGDRFNPALGKYIVKESIEKY